MAAQNIKTEAEPAENAAPARRKGFLRRFFGFFGRLLKYCVILLFVAILAIAGAGYWITQTENGQAWLVKTANSTLAPAPGADGLAFKLTALTGSIPAHFEFGIESSDKNGVWLVAPRNTFALDWRKLPKAIVISQISMADADISRLPDLPPAAPKPPSEPLSLAEIRNLLAQAADFLAQRHWWLPQIRIEEIKVENLLLPEELFPAPDKTAQRLRADLGASLVFVDNRASANAEIALKNGLGQRLALPSAGVKNISLALSASAGPAPDGLAASASLNAALDKPLLAVGALPADFLGPRPELSLALQAQADTAPGRESLAATLTGPDLKTGLANMSAHGGWNSGSGWREGKIGGNAAYDLKLTLNPLRQTDKESPLAALKAPASLALALQGDLPKLQARLDLDCAQISQSGHNIDDLRLALKSGEITLPLAGAAASALEQENELALNLSALVDKRKIALTTNLFFQALAVAPDSAKGWRAGLRHLQINALGLVGNGDIAVLLPEGEKPGLDGKIRLQVKDWAETENFVPGQKFSGEVDALAALASGAPASAINPGDKIVLPKQWKPRQNVDARIAIPAFAMKGKDSSVELAGVEAKALLEDLFANPAINASLDARKLAAAGMSLAASLKANGLLSGPLRAQASARGDVNAQIAAQWQPGEARIDALELTADLGRFLPLGDGKKLLAGLRASQKAVITYGDAGIAVKNLDLRLLPSGRLAANGGLSPQKLDLRADLRDFQLKPLQAINQAIPSGLISLTASLSGSPSRPAGEFRLNLKDIAVPKSPLGPVSATVGGKIEHGRGNASALRISLGLDPKTVRALGGSIAQISASVPLLFGADGVPRPDMNGSLAAKVRWDGALGPIWNLLPIADQRLNGRVGVDISAGGTLGKPKISGNAVISKARYENLMLGVLLMDINARVDLADTGALPGAMKLTASVSDGRGGTVTVNGGGELNGEKLDIKAKINRLKPLRRRDIHIELSGHAEVAGSAQAPAITGEIIVDKGEVLLNNIVMTGSVTTLDISNAAQAPRKKEDAKQKAKAVTPVGSLNVKISMLPRFSVEGRGLASMWKANLLVYGPLNDPKVNGDISCVRGNFDFLGKNFALTRGVVFFGGGSLSNPLVDIDLTNETPDLTAHILVTGPANKIRLRLTSDPDVPRDEILSRVLFGRSVNDLSRAEALQLAGAVAQLAGFGGGGGLFGAAKKALGVDVLRLGTSDTGSTGDNNAGGTNIEMGKYINDYIYMGVQQGLEADSTAFIVEIEITPRSSFELRTEQNNTWGGFKWKYNY